MFNKIRELWKNLFWNEFKNSSLLDKSKVIRDIFITLLTFLVPILIFCLQTRHDENSLRPYINFNLGRNKNNVVVELENAGVGPAIINNIIVKQDGEIIQANNLYDAINWDAEYSYIYQDGSHSINKNICIEFATDYMIDFLGDSLAAGESMTLLCYEPSKKYIDNESDDKEKNNFITEQVRTMRFALSNMNIIIEYQDIYGNTFRSYVDFDTYREQFII